MIDILDFQRVIETYCVEMLGHKNEHALPVSDDDKIYDDSKCYLAGVVYDINEITFYLRIKQDICVAKNYHNVAQKVVFEKYTIYNYLKIFEKGKPCVGHINLSTTEKTRQMLQSDCFSRTEKKTYKVKNNERISIQESLVQFFFDVSTISYNKCSVTNFSPVDDFEMYLNLIYSRFNSTMDDNTPADVYDYCAPHINDKQHFSIYMNLEAILLYKKPLCRNIVVKERKKMDEWIRNIHYTCLSNMTLLNSCRKYAIDNYEKASAK